MPEDNSRRRPFATGSKPGPDAVDHYLESQGFYRKHVARDASSLFRCVAEQVFDIQNYHEKIRQDCAAYMETRPKEYANEVDKNFYNYISQLRRVRTHGSLLELRVMARMYQKNVILYEPTQNLQTTTHVYVQDDAYDKNEPLRVFYSHKDKHFDVIYTMDYVEKLAECQAIVYNIIYTNVFKLPDVKYAVERMLHDQEEQTTLPLPSDPTKYITQAGDIIPFDSPSESNCVLKDPKTCHFHNQVDFENIVSENRDAITVINRTDEPGRLKIFKPIDGFLHNKEKSCVRQLLDERITPFPYKVAKTLDPSIYRNTEFELWSENRKEQRLKWLDSAEFPMKQHVDDKWMYDYEKHRRGGHYGMRKLSDKYEQQVVDENGYNALDEETKKKYIVLNPTADSFKLHQFMGFDHFVPSKDSLELTVMPANIPYRGTYKKRGGGRYNNNNTYYQNSYHHNRSDQFNSSQAQYSQMTYVSEIEPQYQEPREGQHQQNVFQSHSDGFTYEGQSQPNAHIYQQVVPQSWNSQMMPQYQPIQYAARLNYQNVMPYGNFTIPPPQAASITPADSTGDNLNILRENELASTAVDWKAKESSDSSGSDLPLNDVPTLQFYYNLGVRYFLAAGVKRRLETVATQIEKLDLNDHSRHDEKAGGDQTNVDPPPVPTNTPVTTKLMGGNYGPPSNRFPNNSHHNFRRPLTVNRDNNSRDGFRGAWNNNNPRKEIKFNSNVKNVHKNDMKQSATLKASVSESSTIQTQTFHATGSQPPPNVVSQEKNSPVKVNSAQQFSPLSPITSEAMVGQYQPQEFAPVFQPQGQQPIYYNSAPQMQPFVQPGQQQSVAMIYQMNEEGGYTLHQMPQQQIQYAPSPQYAPYQYPQPVYYPMQNYQQPPMDASTISSNDSGMVDQTVYPQGYHQQPPLQYYQAPMTLPLYYAPTPLPQTPHMAQAAPVFPVPQPAPPIVAQIAPFQPNADTTEAKTIEEGNA